MCAPAWRSAIPAAPASSARGGGDVAAIDGDEGAGGVARQCQLQEGLRDILGGDLAAEQVATHVLRLGHAVGGGSCLDVFRRHDAAADAVGIDRVGANAGAAVFERV